MKIHHLTIAVRGRRSLAHDEAQRRELVRVIARCTRGRSLLFSLVDDHLHSLLRAKVPGYLGRELRLALRRVRPDLELKPANFEEVGNRAYLRWLVRYLLTQPAKHDLTTPPSLWTGCCFQDLVGARILPGFDRRSLLEELPRFRLRDAFEHVGLSPVRLEPATNEQLRRAGAARLVDLATGAFAAGPSLSARSRTPHTVRARRVAAVVGTRVGLPASELGHYLGVQPRSIRLLAGRGAEPVEITALRLRLALEIRALKSRSTAA